MGRSNPLRYNCEKLSGDSHYSQCFNKKKRPKIEQFSKFLRGSCSFGDVDAITEESGNALILEWKSTPEALSTGQRIMWQRLTVGKRFSVLCLAGDPETMIVTHRAGFV